MWLSTGQLISWHSGFTETLCEVQKMTDKNLLGRRLKRVRKMRGLGQRELADQAHISFQTVGHCERGETYPQANVLRSMAQVLGVSTDYLLGLKDSDPAIDEYRLNLMRR